MDSAAFSSHLRPSSTRPKKHTAIIGPLRPPASHPASPSPSLSLRAAADRNPCAGHSLTMFCHREEPASHPLSDGALPQYFTSGAPSHTLQERRRPSLSLLGDRRRPSLLGPTLPTGVYHISVTCPPSLTRPLLARQVDLDQ